MDFKSNTYRYFFNVWTTGIHCIYAVIETKKNEWCCRYLEDLGQDEGLVQRDQRWLGPTRQQALPDQGLEYYLVTITVLRIGIIFYRSGSRFWTKSLRIRIQTELRYGSGSRQKRIQYQGKSKETIGWKTLIFHALCVYFILLNYHFSLLSYKLGLYSWDLFSVFNGFCGSGSVSSDTDPDTAMLLIRIRNATD